jgi:DNA polymerase V
MILRGEVSELKPVTNCSKIEIPGIGSLIKGGFQNPADDFFREALNIGDLLIKNLDSTYYGYAWSDSMEPVIYEGQMILLDISLPLFNGNYGVFELNGELCMKRFWKEKGIITLHSENKKHQPIVIEEWMTFNVKGKIIHAIQSF